MSNCPHLVGWTRTGGESRCDRCGTRRFDDYAAIRPSGLPAAITPSPAARRAADLAAVRNVSMVTASRRAPEADNRRRTRAAYAPAPARTASR
ncbi:DUF6255 family natural product biosynthesis protein [Streptomyces sp. NPDC046261]|uniref:DUF6255 family natural product biosynthesis protein n=1 Tax=Streptomyces sp. NPDC046261 TaxID=3157200 RepID=UPI0033C71EC6